METSIRFFGACGTVTGSRFLVEHADDNILIDCGLFQGPREIRQLNRDPFPIPPADINHVAITHAHIDHSGYLPRLVRQGFDGKIHATCATSDLLQILLPDAAMIQEEDAAYYNRKKLSRHKKALPLYNSLDVKRALAHIQEHKPEEPFKLGENFQIVYHTIGHILGASMIYLKVGRGEDQKDILFSGDIGRYGVPILKDPVPPPQADCLVIESTYGDRLHTREPSPREQLAEVVNRIYENKGVLLIPSFAVGRTQNILYHLRVLEEEGTIPELPVFVDSPMAISVTNLYYNHPEHFDVELVEYISEDGEFLTPKNFHMTRSPAESRKLNHRDGPIIIISASGMLTGGRIRHHLYHHIQDPSTELLFVGYQAHGTRGRNLIENPDTIHIFKQEVKVRARITQINGFSAHADYEEMLKWASGMPKRPKRIFIVHGEEDVRPIWAKKLQKQFPDSEILIPEIEDSFAID
ncbi:MBL fold metallo-hydrolase [bacterium]|nr:MBL fold metallo-hydrolase [bacterium]